MTHQIELCSALKFPAGTENKTPWRFYIIQLIIQIDWNHRHLSRRPYLIGELLLLLLIQIIYVNFSEYSLFVIFQFQGNKIYFNFVITNGKYTEIELKLCHYPQLNQSRGNEWMPNHIQYYFVHVIVFCSFSCQKIISIILLTSER